MAWLYFSRRAMCFSSGACWQASSTPDAARQIHEICSFWAVHRVNADERSSERDSETHLRSPVLSGSPLEVLRARLNRRNRPVGRVEDVEDLGNSFQGHTTRDRHFLLNAQIDFASRRLREPVAGHNRPVGPCAQAA